MLRYLGTVQAVALLSPASAPVAAEAHPRGSRSSAALWPRRASIHDRPDLPRARRRSSVGSRRSSGPRHRYGVLPAYPQPFRPRADAAAPPARVTVTLVRWPYVNLSDPASLLAQARWPSSAARRASSPKLRRLGSRAFSHALPAIFVGDVLVATQRLRLLRKRREGKADATLPSDAEAHRRFRRPLKMSVVLAGRKGMRGRWPLPAPPRPSPRFPRSRSGLDDSRRRERDLLGKSFSSSSGRPGVRPAAALGWLGEGEEAPRRRARIPRPRRRVRERRPKLTRAASAAALLSDGTPEIARAFGDVNVPTLPPLRP
jgi:hypothetical protein